MSPADIPATFPIGLAVLLLATAGVGAILLVAGNRVLLAGLGLLGALGGAIAGWIAFEVFIPDAPAWVGAVAGGTIAAILLALSARLVIAVMLALILGCAGWMTVSSAERHGFIDFDPNELASVDSPSADGAAPGTGDRIGNGTGNGAASPSSPDYTMRGAVEERLVRLAISFRAPQLERHLNATTSYIGAGVDSARRQWTHTPPALRTLMFASAGMCAFLGLCLGLVAPRFTASGITAALGATLLVLCAAVVIQQFTGGDGADAATAPLPGSRELWLGGWTLLTLAGAVIQTVRKPKATPKPVEE